MASLVVSGKNSMTSPFSLSEIFENDEYGCRVLHLADYCQQSKSYPGRADIEVKCLEFWNQNGLRWINNRIDDYLNCVMSMFTSGNIDRLATVTNLIAVNFHLNDIMGRDLFPNLSPNAQQEARQLIQRLIDLANDQWRSEIFVHPIERAMGILYDQLRANSPSSWFEKFTNLFNYHLEITHQDNTTSAFCRIPTLDEYRTARAYMVGILHSALLVEYANGCFFDWKAMEKEQLATPIKRLQRVVAEVVGFINDLFSFEKEVIDNVHENDSNLILIIALNYPALSLRQIIYRAASIIRDLLKEYFHLSANIREQLLSSKEKPSQTDTVLIYLDGMADFIRTYWHWHSNSPRYKRKRSIWIETNQADEQVFY